jgi:glycosyltransferase involved in cell wall biosynthesis
MKVLLYETGNIGHRPVYRQYYKSALEQSGVIVDLHNEPDYTSLFCFNNYLQKIAAERRCDLVHILTLDDHTRRMFASRAAVTGCAVIGTYYLYQNISHIYKGWAIRQLFKQGKINALIVPSAMSILSHNKVTESVFPLYPLPEPDASNVDRSIKKSDALYAMGLPVEWDDKLVVLIYGVLDKRRGIDRIVRMLEKNISVHSRACFIFAGPIDRASLSPKVVSSLMNLRDKGSVRLIDKWFDSAEAATLYRCADIFCIVPAKEFQGASSTVAQALRFGLVVVAPDDSVAGKCAASAGLGVMFRRDDHDDFARSLGEASLLCGTNITTPSNKECMPLSLDIGEFGKKLFDVYNTVLSEY